jgi:hypothetical protein
MRGGFGESLWRISTQVSIMALQIWRLSWTSYRKWKRPANQQPVRIDSTIKQQDKTATFTSGEKAATIHTD